mgnify:CR=1 FL=1
MNAILFLLLFSTLSFTQDKKITLEEMKVDGIILIDKMVRPEVLDENEIEDETLTDEQLIDEQKLKKKKLTKQLEDLEKRPDLQTMPTAPVIQAPEEVKIPEVAKPAAPKKKVYDFLFDKEKKAVFKTKSFFRSFKIGLGAFSFYPNQYQASGDGGKVGYEFNPALGLGIEYGSPNFLAFQVDTFFTLPKTSPDELMNEFRFGLELHAYFKVLPILRPFVGTTVMFNVLNNKETKIQELPGAQGSFFTVAVPRTSINNTIDVGLELKLKRFSVDFKTSVTSAFDKKKRDMSYGLMVNYYFDWAKKSETIQNTEPDVQFENEIDVPKLEETPPYVNKDGASTINTSVEELKRESEKVLNSSSPLSELPMENPEEINSTQQGE